MNHEFPNIAVKRSPKNTWLVIEYTGTSYDHKHWSTGSHFKRKSKKIAEYKTFEEAANNAELLRTNKNKGN